LCHKQRLFDRYGQTGTVEPTAWPNQVGAGRSMRYRTLASADVIVRASTVVGQQIRG
jgi:hypothetical protein